MNHKENWLGTFLDKFWMNKDLRIDMPVNGKQFDNSVVQDIKHFYL